MEILINYSDIEKAWYPSKEEWINFLNKIQTKNININITKYFIEKNILRLKKKQLNLLKIMKDGNMKILVGKKYQLVY